jgi:hypothetical protein
MCMSGQWCVNEKCSVGVHGCLVVAGLPVVVSGTVGS